MNETHTAAKQSYISAELIYSPIIIFRSAPESSWFLLMQFTPPLFFYFHMASGKRSPFFRAKDYLFSTTKTLIVPTQLFISSNF